MAVGRTFETTDDGQFHWFFIRDLANTSAQTITITPTTDVSLELGRATSQSPYIDTIAFLDSNAVLPADLVPNLPDGGYQPQLPIPEPAGLGFMGIAGWAALRRRR